VLITIADKIFTCESSTGVVVMLTVVMDAFAMPETTVLAEVVLVFGEKKAVALEVVDAPVVALDICSVCVVIS
jgi:DNA relaxase NicK